MSSGMMITHNRDVSIRFVCRNVSILLFVMLVPSFDFSKKIQLSHSHYHQLSCCSHYIH